MNVLLREKSLRTNTDALKKKIKNQLRIKSLKTNTNALKVKSGNQFRVTSRKAYLRNSKKFYSLLKKNKGQETKYFENSSWVANGYNILYGNPKIAPLDGRIIDAGFTSQIFQIKYDKKKVTSDKKYFNPDDFGVNEMQACQTDFSSRVSTSVEELKNSLGVSAKVKAGYGPFAFSANTEFSTMASSIAQKKKVYISSSAECGVYVFTILPLQTPELTEEFILYLQSLNGLDYNTENEEVFHDFFAAFGTHYMGRITMGSRYTYVEEMSSEDLESLKKEGLKVEVEASASVVVSVSASVGVNNQNESKSSYLSKISNHWATSIGAPMPPNLKREDWLAGTTTTPMPISYDLVPLTQLLTKSKKLKENLKKEGLDADKLSVQLGLAFNDYCESLLRKNLVSACEFKDGNKPAIKKDVPLTSAEFTFCSAELAQCYFSDYKLVKFSRTKEEIGFYKIEKNVVKCSDEIFGNPWISYDKSCFITGWDDGTWKECATYGEICKVTKRSIIAYGHYAVTEAVENVVCSLNSLKENLKKHGDYKDERIMASMQPTLMVLGQKVPNLNVPTDGVSCWIKTYP